MEKTTINVSTVKEEMKPFLERQEVDHDQIRANTQTLTGSDGVSGMRHVVSMQEKELVNIKETLDKSKGAFWLSTIVGILIWKR